MNTAYLNELLQRLVAAEVVARENVTALKALALRHATIGSKTFKLTSRNQYNPVHSSKRI